MQNQIPNNWQKVKLGEVALLNPTVSLKKEEKYSFIPMEDLDWSKKYAFGNKLKAYKGGAKFEEGDVLFARITPCLENGKIGRTKELKDGKGFGSTEYFVIRGKENISDTDFLYYLCRTNKVRQTAINSMIGASGRQRANINSLGNYELLFPNYFEQKRISSFLSSFDNKIELNNKIAKTLEDMTSMIFKEWFLKKVKSEKLKVKSGKIKDIAFVKTGNRPGKLKEKKENDFTVPVYGAREIMGYTNKSLYNQKIIITGRVGTIGEVYLVDGYSWPSDNALIIYPRNDDYFYLLYFLAKKINYLSLNRGSSQPLIAQSDIENYLIDLPNEIKIKEFNTLVSKLFILKNNKENENQKLSLMRDLLLPKLMKGEIRV